MCVVIVRTSFKAAGEPSTLVEFDDEAAAEARVEELKQLETVATIATYKRHSRHQRVQVWESA